MKRKNILSEAQVDFSKKTLKKFDSFSEMDEADAKEMAALTPKEHLQNTTFLIRQIFADDLRKPMNKKVKFR